MCPEPSPTLKEVAEFFRLAAQCGILRIDDVQGWADGVIAATADPPFWAVHLSLADSADDAISQLREVPGDVAPHVPILMLLACLRLSWSRSNVELRAQARKIFEIRDHLAAWDSDLGMAMTVPEVMYDQAEAILQHQGEYNNAVASAYCAAKASLATFFAHPAHYEGIARALAPRTVGEVGTS